MIATSRATILLSIGWSLVSLGQRRADLWGDVRLRRHIRSDLFIQLVDKALGDQLIDVAVVDIRFQIELARFFDGRKLLRRLDYFGSHSRDNREQRCEELIGVSVPFFIRDAGVFRQDRQTSFAYFV